MTLEGDVLLTTKLCRPLPRSEHISRQRLFDMLERGRSLPLTLVCAGAGFGKTTLVSEWLAYLERQTQEPAAPRSVWLSLDEGDNDLHVFVRYLIAAIQSVVPDACAQTVSLLNHRVAPPLALIYVTLANDLAHLSERLIVVLDDYHLIHNTQIHDLWNTLLRHWPQTLHLVLLTRYSPPFPLVTLRARGQMVEIRNRDLRLTLAEVETYLRLVLPISLADADLRALERQTEGWIAGLQLAGLSLRNGQNIAELLDALSGSNSEVTEYLADEVLFRQPPEVQEFLLETSILDPFCAELCDAVVVYEGATHRAAELLMTIVRNNLFIRSVDDGTQWFRFHPLFRDLLQRRLLARSGRDHANRLHRAAAAWYAGQGLPEKAIDYAIAGEDLVGAAQIMESELGRLLNREDRMGLERWLRLLPATLVESRPGLLLIKAFVGNFRWQLEDVARYTQQAEALLAQDENLNLSSDSRARIKGQIATLNSQYAFSHRQIKAAIQYAKDAYALLPPSYTYLRGGAMFWYALSMQVSGQAETAENELQAIFEEQSNKGDGFALRLLMAIGMIHLQTGRIERAEQTAKLMIRHAQRAQLTVIRAWAHYILGSAYYYQNRLTLAEVHFKEVVALRYQAHSLCAREGAAGLLSVYLASRQYADAQELLELFFEYDMDEKGVVDDITQSAHARLLLAAGKESEAFRWADTFDKPVSPMLQLLFELPQLTKARLLLSHESEGYHLQARHILRELCTLAENTSNTRLQVETLATSALRLKDRTESHVILLRAVKLAQSGGLIRPFVDLGIPMHDLLLSLPPSTTHTAFVSEILANYPTDAVLASTPTTISAATIQTVPLAEPLTNRELQIVGLMRDPLSTKEIAYKLNISYATAKRHSINIYGKLGVNSRWDAVAKAEALGILRSR